MALYSSLSNRLWGWTGWLLAGFLATVSCAPPGPDHSVILVIIDTLRGDRLGAMGYESARTPVLDGLATQGLLFRRAMTPVPVTLPAVASLLTGRAPYHHGVRDNDYFVLPNDETTLAEMFQKRGYHTAAVLASGVLAADRGVNQGFVSYDDAFAPPYAVYTPHLSSMRSMFASTRRRADTVTDLALKQMREDPFFLMVHYFDVHMYYDPPPAFAAMHPQRPYDGEVSFVDQEIGRLLEAVPDPENTLVIVVSDHGESQNEHGEPQHGFLLYESTLHVPVIVRGPGVPVGSVRDDPISLVDLAPTLRSLLSLPKPKASFDGRVLDWERPGKLVPLYAETFRPLVSYGWAWLRAVRLGDMKLIRGGGREEVYDLSRDPHELAPLDGEDHGAALKEPLERCCSQEDPETIRETARGIPDTGRRELLESLGYIGGGGNQGKDRPHPQDALPGWIRAQLAKEVKRMAIHRFDAGDYPGLGDLADSLVQLDPQDPEARYLRAEWHHHLGSVPAARSDYQEAINHGNRILSLTAQARLAELEGEGEKASKHWRSAWDLDKNVWMAAEFLGKWHFDRTEFEEALPYLRQLVAMNPGAAEVRLMLGRAAWNIGLKDQGKRHLEAWLEGNPDHPQAESVRDQLATQ